MTETRKRTTNEQLTADGHNTRAPQAFLALRNSSPGCDAIRCGGGWCGAQRQDGKAVRSTSDNGIENTNGTIWGAEAGTSKGILTAGSGCLIPMALTLGMADVS
ncbi:hypothetical protein E4U40_007399 [Claviceps sp. LM458 group G5]|nr:hypothetical protein E4U40_007399 [Claviceps sp. LM458 group G5]